MDEIYIRNVSHLGDVLVILNLLYSQSNPQNKIIHGPAFIPELLEIFDYGFQYAGLAPSMPFEFPCQIIHFFPPIRTGVLRGNRANMLFLGDGGFFRAKQEPIVEIKIPPVKLSVPEPENFVAFQFDSRSIIPMIGKTVLDKETMIRALKLFSNLPPIGLGGKETIPYLDYSFRLGTLHEIVLNFMKCRQFVGSDSGLSLLAGMLGIPGSVVSCHSVETYIQEITQFYKLMFPTLKVYRRNLKPVNDSYIKFL